MPLPLPEKLHHLTPTRMNRAIPHEIRKRIICPHCAREYDGIAQPEEDDSVIVCLRCFMVIPYPSDSGIGTTTPNIHPPKETV